MSERLKNESPYTGPSRGDFLIALLATSFGLIGAVVVLVLVVLEVVG